MEEQGMLNYVKKVIHSLVVSTPMRVSVESLKRDYLNEEGSAVPFIKLGFKNIESFLRSIPDTVTVIGCGPMAEVQARMNAKTEHIQNLVMHQKKPSINSRGRKPKYAYPSAKSNLVFANERYNQNRRFNYNNNNYNQAYRRNRSPPINNNYNQYSRQEQQSSVYYHQKETNSMTKSFAKFNIANVDDESSSDELVMYLPDKDKIDNKNEIPSNSPVQFSQLEKKAIENPSVNISNEKPIGSSPIQYASSDEGCDEDAIPASSVDERVLNIKYTEIIESNHLVNNRPLAVPVVKEAIKEPITEYISSDEGSDSEAVPKYAVDDRVIGVEYPRDTVRIGYSLPDRDIHKKLKPDDRIKVQLVTVTSPHSFYFWLHDEEYDKYKALSINMQRYYDNIDDKRYTIPMFLIKPGHLAAVKDLFYWQRVQILNIETDPKKNIEVEYIDTGKKIWVCPSMVKYLCKEFATLPPQCLYGRLSCVVPRQGTHFSKDANNYFYDLVSYRRLFAKIDKINEKDNTVHMILVDLDASSYAKNINMALIESGLVRRCFKV